MPYFGTSVTWRKSRLTVVSDTPVSLICDWAHHGSITEASQAVDESPLSAYCEVSIITFPTSEQTETMRVALDMACKELGLRQTDGASRAKVESSAPHNRNFVSRRHRCRDRRGQCGGARSSPLRGATPYPKRRRAHLTADEDNLA